MGLASGYLVDVSRDRSLELWTFGQSVASKVLRTSLASASADSGMNGTCVQNQPSCTARFGSYMIVQGGKEGRSGSPCMQLNFAG